MQINKDEVEVLRKVLSALNRLPNWVSPHNRDGLQELADEAAAVHDELFNVIVSVVARAEIQDNKRQWARGA